MKTTLKQIGIILLVSGFFALIANLIHPRPIPWIQQWSDQVESKVRAQGIQVISTSLVLRKMRSSETVFIDARSKEEFEKGHIPGAVSIPFQSLDPTIPRVGNLLDSNQERVIYCSNRDCDDALLLAVELKSMGAENLAVFVDGYMAWEQYAELMLSIEGGILP